MQKSLSVSKAQQTLPQLINEISQTGDDYIIECLGKPLAAIISMEKYQILLKNREKASQALDAIWEKMKGENPETVEGTIDEAVKWARNI